MPTTAKPRFIDRIVGPSPRERELDMEVNAVNEVLSKISMKLENSEIGGEGFSAHEALANIDLMIDAQGWTSVFEYDDKTGLTLRQVKEASEQIRELLVGNPFVGNGARIRAAHVWGGGVDFSCRNRTGKRKVTDMPANIQDLMETPWGQRYIFGNKAHSELERAAFSDGMLFFLGHDRTKQIQRLQIHEFNGMLHNPNNTEEIWAYRRVWSRRPFNRAASEREEVVRWYYTDIFPGTRKSRIKGPDGQIERAETEYTLIDMSFNRQVGWALGVPDALAIVAWARLYKEFMVNGYVMSRSLARLAYKVTVASTTAGKKASTEIVAPGQAGATAAMGQGNDLQALSTAGKGYDFSSGNSLASAMAAGLGVSLLALLSNPSAATGSNAAAQTLDPIAKATAQVRRNEWEDEFLRLFRFMGLVKTLVTTWRELSDETLQRMMQAYTLIDGLEVIGGDVMQREVARVMNIPDPGDLPGTWKPKSQRVKPTDTGVSGRGGATDGSGQGSDDDTGDTAGDHNDDSTD